MRCGACQRESPEAASFCMHCGQVLRAAAGGAPNARRPGDYTPRHLAERVLQLRGSLEGERKQVTVLFADVQGSMELALALDPEEWHGILDRFFRILSEGVHRFEGTVNQYTGDGIMALFGAPLAHEDHALRACHAALVLRDEVRRYGAELRRDRGLSFSARIGLNSGEVVVGRIGDDLRMDYTAQGQVVGVADRIQKLAEPGTIYLADATARLAQGFFVLRELGEFTLRGASEGLRVCELEGVGVARSRFDAARARGLSTFVGRDGEMALLEDALARAREGRGRAIGITAEPGTGKSRLAHEFLKRCRSAGIPVEIVQCVPHGRHVPLLPLMESLRTLLGLAADEPAESARDRIAGRMLRVDPALAAEVPLLLDFLGVADPRSRPPDLSAEARQERIAGVVRRLRDAQAGEVTVALYEDLHWVDPATEAITAATERELGSRARLVLQTFRPEYEPPWSGAPGYETLSLAVLSASAFDELLASLLGAETARGELGGRIAAAARGNPFFAEEIVRSLVESGVLEGERGATRPVRAISELVLPESVQTLLQARIDGLADREKGLLQLASVIDEVVPRSVLAAVAGLGDRDLDAALHALVAAGFLVEASLYPEIEYGFAHPLVQAVAYGSQLGDWRRRTHRKVAKALADRFSERLDEKAAVLAHHFEAAGEDLDAARWHERAALWIRPTDPVAATRHLQVMRRLAESSKGRAAPRLRLRAYLALLGRGQRLVELDEAQQIFEAGRRLALEQGDARAAGELHLFYGWHLFHAGQLDLRAEILERARSLVEPSADPVLRFRLAAAHSLTQAVTAGAAQSRAAHEEALHFAADKKAILEDRGARADYLAVLMRLAFRVGREGDLEAGFRELDAVIDLAKSWRELQVERTASSFGIQLAQVAGDPERAHRYAAAEARCGEVLAERTQWPFGMALLVAGRPEEAIPLLESDRAWLLGRTEQRHVATRLLIGLANATLASGDAVAGRRIVDEALAWSQRWPNAGIEADLLLLRVRGERAFAEAGFDGAGHDRVAELLDAAEAHVETAGFLSYRPQLLEERARLHALRGDAAGAAADLREACAGYEQVGARGHARRLRAEVESD